MAPQIDVAEVARRFTHYPPDDDRARVHEGVRAAYRELGGALALMLPEGREKSLAFTALEESIFWANAAVAREGT